MNDETEKDDADTVAAHEIVYVYKFIMNIEGMDYIWYTLGTETLLTEPTPLSEVNPDGMRNYVSGMMTFRFASSSTAGPGRAFASRCQQALTRRVTLGLTMFVR